MTTPNDISALATTLRMVAANPHCLEIARRAIEDSLIFYRDHGVSEFLRNNGCVCKTKDGQDSSIIRFGPESAVRIGLMAIADFMEKGVGVMPFTMPNSVHWVQCGSPLDNGGPIDMNDPRIVVIRDEG